MLLHASGLVRWLVRPERLKRMLGARVRQLPALGQFAGPPLVAWMVAQVGGWKSTGWVTSVCCAIGLSLERQLE
ncbi:MULTISPECIES: hypothetical protein [unclassified Polaromonas]|uniref:hypothetical protein n=1 Tax=unclassified Polaromonas TaxID=2638319 RepID=UPI0018CBA77E|nr:MULTISPECIES: hypothetical protein [unclassified Polaromonas]MBG6071879.1 hypothetical protein [Polaromonas sp. CG_9.7]MBG6113881.1 hypothetical protein [Polaromonas sp. CG_9.2]MDH6183798.1 hypothetical protein [Polaromonas sp. CG_23.6]